MASTVSQVTVAATANDAGASVEFTPDDTDSGTTGHQVNLSAGKNTVTITAKAADENLLCGFSSNILVLPSDLAQSISSPRAHPFENQKACAVCTQETRPETGPKGVRPYAPNDRTRRNHDSHR